jgi:general stress protein 26
VPRDKDHEIAAHHEIGLVFTDKDENAYLSITASAETLRDRDIAGAIWKTSDTASCQHAYANSLNDGPNAIQVILTCHIARTEHA